MPHVRTDNPLDVAYRTIDSPVGELLLAATPQGLARIAFAYEGFDEVIETLEAKLSPRVFEATGQLDNPASELDEYFSGKLTKFEVPLDFSLSSGFRQTVQQYLTQIAYGFTSTYKQVAEAVGNPKASRAVGSACATNPLPIMVPCHRVLRSDGTLGGYLGSLKVKTALLDLESAVTLTGEPTLH